MHTTYAITWQDETSGRRAGRLELAPTAVLLEGWNGEDGTSLEIPYSQLAAVRVGRAEAERVDGRPALILEREGSGPVKISGLAEPGILGELADKIAAARGAASLSRVVVIVPLQPGAAERAAQLLTNGPPFDPEAAGLDRHEVYLTEEEAIFVFESVSQETLHTLVSDASLWAAAAAWNDIIAAPPRLAADVFAWQRAESLASGDISFASTPGPGDSEGGDVYAPAP